MRCPVILIFIMVMVLFFVVSKTEAAQDLPDYSNETEYAAWSAILRGSYMNLFTFRHLNDSASYISESVNNYMTADLNRLSVSPEISHGENFIFHADVNFKLIISDYNKTEEFDLYWRDSEYNDFTRPSIEPVYNDMFFMRSEFQNIYCKFTSGAFTGTAGRQQVRFGSARLWNPLDILNPFSPVHVEGSDEQRGIDALRIDFYPGESTEFTCVANPVRRDDQFEKTSFDSSNYAVRLKTGISEFDAALLAAYTAKRRNAGFDLQLVLFDGLLTGVVLWSDQTGGESYLQCGAGYEYSFANGLYLLAEYFYNSLPVNDDMQLQAALAGMNTAGINPGNYYILANRIITFNSHYVSALAGYDIHPLLRCELFSIYDFQGRGIFCNISFRFNAMQNLDINAGSICSFVNDQDRVSDFISYDMQPLLYASAELYF